MTGTFSKCTSPDFACLYRVLPVQKRFTGKTRWYLSGCQIEPESCNDTFPFVTPGDRHDGSNMCLPRALEISFEGTGRGGDEVARGGRWHRGERMRGSHRMQQQLLDRFKDSRRCMTPQNAGATTACGSCLTSGRTRQQKRPM